MAVRNIIQIGEDILRKKVRKYEVFDQRLHTLLDDMLQTMQENDGVGIAAPQVCVLRSAFIALIDEVPTEFVNAVIVDKSGCSIEKEGCLSLKGYEHKYVQRPTYVKVEAYDRNGVPFTLEATDFNARVICHEMDHLEGVLYIDNVIEGYEPEEEEDQ